MCGRASADAASKRFSKVGMRGWQEERKGWRDAGWDGESHMGSAFGWIPLPPNRGFEAQNSAQRRLIPQSFTRERPPWPSKARRLWLPQRHVASWKATGDGVERGRPCKAGGSMQQWRKSVRQLPGFHRGAVQRAPGRHYPPFRSSVCVSCGFRHQPSCCDLASRLELV